MFAIPYPAIDPVAFQIGPFAVKWYGLAYMAGLLIGWVYIKRLLREPALWHQGKAPMSPVQVDDLLLYMTLGVVVGGRLGFALLYEPAHYLRHPAEILQIWRGGMSFHGAFLGCALAIWLFGWRAGTPFLSIVDLCTAAAPIGLFFGRLANFVNSELWGRPTRAAWGMVFPDGGPEVRHPSQLYEAALEGLALFLVLRWLTHARGALAHPGLVGGTFLLGYGLARSLCELFREPHLGHALNIGPLTAGIVYSLPMIAAGIWLIRRARSGAAAEA
jgi:phosphatidylglycerol:prolipoprotein diacylglycerol transferase